MRTLIVLLALAAPTFAQTQEDADAAMTFYIRCLGSAAQQLDDGVSDALSVAIGIDTACDQYKRHALRTFIAAMDINPDSPAGQDILQGRMEDHETAVGVVLTVRANATD